MDQVTKFADLDPSIPASSIVEVYTRGVANYLNSPEREGTATNSKIDLESKKRVAEDAIRQFANLSATWAQDPNTVLNSKQAADSISAILAEQIGSSVQPRAQQIMAAVETLAPRGWFGGPKAAPSEQEFLKTVEKNTGSTLDESIARAIYAVYLRAIHDQGNTPDSPTDAVHSLLYPSSTTLDWNNSGPFDLSKPFTPDQFARNVGSIYASNIVSQSFNPVR